MSCFFNHLKNIGGKTLNSGVAISKSHFRWFYRSLGWISSSRLFSKGPLIIFISVGVVRPVFGPLKLFWSLSRIIHMLKYPKEKIQNSSNYAKHWKCHIDSESKIRTIKGNGGDLTALFPWVLSFASKIDLILMVDKIPILYEHFAYKATFWNS